jgi:hypothetical protein
MLKRPLLLLFSFLVIASCGGNLDIDGEANPNGGGSALQVLNNNMYFTTGNSSSYNMLSNATGSAQWSMSGAPSGASINSSTGEISWAVPTAGVHPVTVTVKSGGKSASKSVDITVSSLEICVWSGRVDSDFNTAANWQNCGVPDTSKWVCIPSYATNMPTVSANNLVKGFGPCEEDEDGGDLIVNSGFELRLIDSSKNLFQSDVRLLGNSTTCTDCIVATDIPNNPAGYNLGSTSSDTYVVNGATLTLGKGSNLALWNHTHLYLGDGSTAGHLVTEGGTDPNEHPRLSTALHQDPAYHLPFGHGNRHLNGVVIQGVPAGEKSSVNIDGIKVMLIDDHYLGYHTFQFISEYEIKKFDSIDIGYYPTSSNAEGVRILNCSSGLFTDTNWTGFDLGFNGAYTVMSSISTNCDLGTTINVQEFPSALGETWETDPNNNFSWY